MGTQIAVRLPEDMVEFLDELVARGEAASRAQVVARALQRERRRRGAERDAAIYAAEAGDTEMDEFVAHTARPDLSDLD